MKTRIPFAILCLFALASCSTVRYSNKVENQSVAQQCTYTPLVDSIENLVNKGYGSVTLVPGGNYLYCDSIYSIGTTWSQAREYRRQFGISWTPWVGGAFAAGNIGTYIYLTSAGIVGASSVILPVVGIMVAGPMIGAPSEWPKWNADREIRKFDYVNFYSKDFSYQEHFWKGKAIAY